MHTHATEQIHSPLARGCVLPPPYSHFLACFTETHPLCFVGQDTHTGRAREVCNSVTVWTQQEAGTTRSNCLVRGWCKMRLSNNRGEHALLMKRMLLWLNSEEKEGFCWQMLVMRENWEKRTSRKRQTHTHLHTPRDRRHAVKREDQIRQAVMLPLSNHIGLKLMQCIPELQTSTEAAWTEG